MIADIMISGFIFDYGVRNKRYKYTDRTTSLEREMHKIMKTFSLFHDSC